MIGRESVGPMAGFSARVWAGKTPSSKQQLPVLAAAWAELSLILAARAPDCPGPVPHYTTKEIST